MSHPIARLTAGATIGAIVASGLFAAPSAYAAPAPARDLVVDPAASASAAAWLTRQLKDNLLQYSFGSPNFGSSIDFARGLDADDLQPTTVQSVSDAVAAHVDDYITGEAFGDTGSTYAGPVAKALRMAQTAGDVPTSYGGVNLVTRLEGRVSTVAASSGRISDASTYGDNANTLGQAFAATGLTLAGSALADEATSFLLTSQCPSGYFRQSLGATSADSCQAATDSPSVDATAVAVTELQEQRETPGVADAITKANDWLAGVQAADGSFGSDAAITTANANSTGLAAQALGVSGRGALASKAAVWLRQRQLVGAGTCQPFKAVDRGAVAYDRAAYDQVRSGMATTATDQFTLATAQTLGALAFAPAGRPVASSAAAKFVKAGAKLTVHLTGAAPGSPVCGTTFGFSRFTLASTAGVAGFVVTLPKTTALRTVTVTGPGYARTVTRRALAPLDVPVVLASQAVEKGGSQTVRVGGLAPGENVVVRFRGLPVAHGRATTAGRFVRTFKVYRKVGTFRVDVRGQFPQTRHGVATFRVTR